MIGTKTLITVAGIAVVWSLLSVSCAPLKPTSGGGDHGRSIEGQGPPPADYSQPVIGQRAEYRREMAKESRDAAYTFQKQGFVKQAVTKYRESLTWWPDPPLDAYIETVERAAGLPLSGQRTPWTAAPRPPASKKREVIATIRNRSPRDVYIVTEGGSESPESRFLPGEIREVAVLPNAYGEVVFSASRGGSLLATTTWRSEPDDMRVVPVVLFDDREAEKLVVMTGFRLK